MWRSCRLPPLSCIYTFVLICVRVPQVLVLTIGWGMGNGMFLSVDYALACDVLPSLEHAAQSLGVWGVSAFLGSTLGPLIAGPLLTHFGGCWTADCAATAAEYSTPGYVAVMLLGAVYVICAGLMLRTVKAR